MGPMQGSGGVWLGKRELVFGRGRECGFGFRGGCLGQGLASRVRARLRILGLAWVLSGGWKRFHVGQADEAVTLHLLVLGDLQGNWAEGSVCLGWMLMLLRDVRLRAIIGRAMLHRLVKELSNGT